MIPISTFVDEALTLGMLLIPLVVAIFVANAVFKGPKSATVVLFEGLGMLIGLEMAGLIAKAINNQIVGKGVFGGGASGVQGIAATSTCTVSNGVDTSNWIGVIVAIFTDPARLIETIMGCLPFQIIQAMWGLLGPFNVVLQTLSTSPLADKAKLLGVAMLVVAFFFRALRQSLSPSAPVVTIVLSSLLRAVVVFAAIYISFPVMVFLAEQSTEMFKTLYASFALTGSSTNQAGPCIPQIQLTYTGPGLTNCGASPATGGFFGGLLGVLAGVASLLFEIVALGYVFILIMISRIMLVASLGFMPLAIATLAYKENTALFGWWFKLAATALLTPALLGLTLGVAVLTSRMVENMGNTPGGPGAWAPLWALWIFVGVVYLGGRMLKSAISGGIDTHGVGGIIGGDKGSGHHIMTGGLTEIGLGAAAGWGMGRWAKSRAAREERMKKDKEDDKKKGAPTPDDSAIAPPAPAGGTVSAGDPGFADKAAVAKETAFADYMVGKDGGMRKSVVEGTLTRTATPYSLASEPGKMAAMESYKKSDPENYKQFRETWDKRQNAESMAEPSGGAGS